jgi:hypothetical protein
MTEPLLSLDRETDYFVPAADAKATAPAVAMSSSSVAGWMMRARDGYLT